MALFRRGEDWLFRAGKWSPKSIYTFYLPLFLGYLHTHYLSGCLSCLFNLAHNSPGYDEYQTRLALVLAEHRLLNKAMPYQYPTALACSKLSSLFCDFRLNPGLCTKNRWGLQRGSEKLDLGNYTSILVDTLVLVIWVLLTKEHILPFECFTKYLT